jgi:hypothetical protein
MYQFNFELAKEAFSYNIIPVVVLVALYFRV